MRRKIIFILLKVFVNKEEEIPIFYCSAEKGKCVTVFITMDLSKDLVMG
jgi:hypothetical protein